MYVKHRIEMDLAGQAVMPRVDMVERDQYVRQLGLVLFCNGEPWTIPQDIHALVCFQKADGTGGVYDTIGDGIQAWSVSGNELTVDIAPQVLSCAGPVMLAVDILRGSGKVSTFTIMLYVQEAIPLALESGDYYRFDGFLTVPEFAEEGQLLRIAEVDDNNTVTRLEGYSLQTAVEQALAKAKQSGEFDGPSAYEVAQSNGFAGTEEEWLESLQGEDGTFTAELGDIQQINITGKLTTDSAINVNFHGTRLQGVKEPIADTDAANKVYVDRAAETAASGYQVPQHWQSAVDAVIEKVTALQDAGGRQCLSFAYFSDTHVVPDITAPNAGHTGNLAAAVMEGCRIPFAVMCGDAARIDADSAESARKSLAAAEENLRPIGWQQLLQAAGECDGNWDSGQLDAKGLYGAVFRKQAEDVRRVFGGDGSYYYVDYPAAKVRFVVLNSCWADDAVHRIESFGYGNAQLHWLASTALQFTQEGWGVVLAAHVPPLSAYASEIRDLTVLRGILSAFQNQDSYSGTAGTAGEWDYVDLSCDYTESVPAEIIGFFSGHSHVDALVADEAPYAVVTVASDGDLTGERKLGSTDEHVLDFVTINREQKQVNITRLGPGGDRIYGYDGVPYILYTVSYALTNCTSDCHDTLMEELDYYYAELTAEDGYTLTSVTVTMGGEDITQACFTDGIIEIYEVTGNIVITAVAEA